MKLSIALLLIFVGLSAQAQCPPSSEDICSMNLEDLEVEERRGSITGTYLYLGNIENDVASIGQKADVEFLRLDTQFQISNRTVHFEVRGPAAHVNQFFIQLEAYRSAAGLYY